MRKILCFGDSNTYGYSPIDGTQFDDSIRWPGVVNSLLGDKFEVVIDGKNGRTVAFDDPYNPGCNGMSEIGSVIENNEPLDLVIIMLGTNDLKVYFESNPRDIAANLKEMCEIVKSKTEAKILLLSPALLGDQIEFSPLHLEFGRTQVDYSFDLAPEIQRVANEVEADFIDLAMIAVSSDVDCLHLMPEEHAKVAKAVTDKVLKMFEAELAAEAAEEEARRKAEEEEARRKAEEEEARRKAEEEEARRKAEEEEARRKAEEEEEARRKAAEEEEEARRKAAEEEEEARRKAAEEEEARRIAEEEASLKVEEASQDKVSEEEPEEFGTLDLVLDEEEEDLEAEHEARLKVEAILKAAEEEVAREESEKEAVLNIQTDEESTLSTASFLDEPTEANIFTPVDANVKEATVSSISSADVGNEVDTFEKDRMLEGKLYKVDKTLRAMKESAASLTKTYNETSYVDQNEREEILTSLFREVGKGVDIEPPFRCNYGSNVMIGENFSAGFNCVILDDAEISIGNNVSFGPSVNLYAASQPIYAPVRNQNFQCSEEITIGDDVWVGGNVTINPGVHIGSNVVIGSGSVVTSDIPDGVVAAGNPCRIIRRISDADKMIWEGKVLE